MKEDLIRKASGSENQYHGKGPAYKEQRHTKKEKNRDIKGQKMKSRGKYKKSNVSQKPLGRFIQKQVGKKWDDVYKELCERVPVEFRERIFYFVEKPGDVEIVEGLVCPKPHTGKYWYYNNPYLYKEELSFIEKVKKYYNKIKILGTEYDRLFIHPETNILTKVSDFNNKKK